ncbi:hypothetical protein MJO28_014732 [Puccinia striiformis f. sp. tritici]|uniref:Uncharacterized protein n=1 Tax=Puccinia striiformis f. sp. tritici TaxID=168172 RepID=A0ACC0DUH5_9BASI|nr:hypothetical protein MJO28_014732 [Puccinia striiformis f. sp. tritici]
MPPRPPNIPLNSTYGQSPPELDICFHDTKSGTKVNMEFKLHSCGWLHLNVTHPRQTLFLVVRSYHCSKPGICSCLVL